MATELIMEYRYILKSMGIEPDGPVLLLENNNSVVLNCTIPSSVLKKKHNTYSYHRIKETVAAEIIKFSHIPTVMNYTDINTKSLTSSVFYDKINSLLFR